MRIWSEVPRRRTQEVVADVATAGWMFVWVSIGLQLYQTLSQLSSIGVDIGETGAGLERAAASLRLAMSQIPIVGGGVGDLVGGALQGIGSPLVQAGSDLEQLLLIIAAVLGLLLVAVFLIPWLNRYLPWRRQRWSRLNAGDRVIRRGSAAPDEVERFLAARAIARLEYADLLENTPDPIGDYTTGRFDRLASAERESVGLRDQAVVDAGVDDRSRAAG
jgi:hypothetical protein